MSILGVFRGLGIIDSRFVGAVNNTATPYCAAFTCLLNSFACSSMMALLPLTIDRTVAVLQPLRHSSIVTASVCRLMFASTWLSIFAVLVYYIIACAIGTVEVDYLVLQHKCEVKTDSGFIESIIYFIVPFLLVLAMYSVMLVVIVRNNRPRGHFLIIAIGITATNLLSYFPSIIADFFKISMSYETGQILTVTFWYTNGIMNPLIYVASHPQTRKYVVDKWSRKSLRSIRNKQNEENKGQERIAETGFSIPSPLENRPGRIILDSEF